MIPTRTTLPMPRTQRSILSGLLQRAGRTWKSYQEDIDLTASNGQLINQPLAENQWTVPLVNLSGKFGPGNYLNAYNDSTQYNYAPKHNPMVFFSDTNGGNNLTSTNPLARTTRRCNNWRSTWPTTVWPTTTGSRPTSTTKCTAG